MEHKIQEIKKWLKENGHIYAWLAEKCFVSEGCVRNWFAQKNIPKAKLALIEKLIKESAPDHAPPPPASITPNILTNKLILNIDEDLYESIEQSALKNGITVSAYCSLLVEWAEEHQDIVLADILAALDKVESDDSEPTSLFPQPSGSATA